METKQFQAESKRLLEMMIHSIYTHKEIFLRELISNASDAIDKLYFRSLSDNNVGKSREDFKIDLAVNKENRTLTITDNGIGMTKEELEQNLGIIANSGSLKFKQENSESEDTDIIGQFGVGFYSAFMVAKRVTVRSLAYGSDTAYQWQSEGTEGYSIDTCEKAEVGTEIVLELLDNTDDENYDEFLEQYRIKGLIKKYSDYIRFPICMECKHSRKKELPEGVTLAEGESEYEDYFELETLNSMVPIWKKNKNELTDEDYNNFYSEKFFDYMGGPIAHIHSRTEGSVTYNSLLFIPEHAPMNYYSKDYEKGLQLYASGVMIMERCADLLPDYFSFVKGLVDSEDLSLNISREMLQHDKQLKMIAKSLEKSIKNELSKLLKNEREKYETFWKAFGMQLKYGLYSDYGMHKDVLKDLILFTSSAEEKLTTLDEYCTRMREEQKYIYYATAESVARASHLPQTEMVKEKGYEILYLTDGIDEFAIKSLGSYNEKEFKNVSASDLGLETAEETAQQKELAEKNKGLFEAMKSALGDKVSAVKLSSRLKSHPVCITNQGELSLEMEKVLNSMPTEQKVKAERVLELNGEHPIFAKLSALAEDGSDEAKTKLADYTDILYHQALMIEGILPENPSELAEKICKLM